MVRNIFAKMLLGIGLIMATTTGFTQTTPGAATLVWPNAESKANSDDWIRLHHNEIRVMRPRVLVLNFVNGLSAPEAKRRVDALTGALKEASRYHGYKERDATAFLDYQVAKIVDMTDEVPLPEDQRMEGNSSLYPRPADWKPGMVNFQYSELFSEKFAQKYGLSDPANPSKILTLGELLDKGLVHEVWFLALVGNFGAPVRCAEIKQAYDNTLHKIAGKSLQTGNGVASDLPFVGRSLRVLHINSERGAGCAMESLGYALESLATSRAIPYFTRYFQEFANFDLKSRYRIGFDSFYGREPNTELEYPNPTTLVYTRKGEKFRISNFIPIGGSVHFPPSARRDFDIFNNPTTVNSTIEHYRLRDGEGGKDRAEPWTIEKFRVYQATAPDCSGGWMVYWRQSMPGLNTKAVDDNGKPMRNWWVFLFY